MANGVVEVALDGMAAAGITLADGLPAMLDAIREDASARVLLLDATRTLPEDCGLADDALTGLTLFPLPVVFAFEGQLARAATEFALAADIRVCSETASLAGRLARDSRVRTLANDEVAFTLFFGRGVLDAKALLDAGLVTAVTAPGGALAEARRTANVIASRGPIATRLGKEAVWRGLAQPLEQALRFETDLTLLLQTTKDRAEGVRAFLEKRPPRFTGE